VRLHQVALVLAALAGAARAQETERSALEEMLDPDDEVEQPADRRDKVAEISDELTFGSAQATSDSPRERQLANALRGTFYASEAVTLVAGFTYTVEQASPHAVFPGVDYGGKVPFFTLGVDWDLNEHFNVAAHVEGSPESQQFSAFEVRFRPSATQPVQTADLLLRTRSSSAGAGLAVAYDTAGDSPLESAFMVGANVTDLSSDERITRAESGGQAVTLAALRDSCGNLQCTRTLDAILRGQKQTLLQARLSALATGTIAQDTDVSLGGDYYLYSEDPTLLGAFGVATAGRTLPAGGGGVPIAPLRWTLRPEVAHRFGAASARGWVQVGRYVEGGGRATSSLGLKLHYKFSRSFRAWLTLSGQRDTDAAGGESKAAFAGLGAGYKF
jgi:hypothetical protein